MTLLKISLFGESQIYLGTQKISFNRNKTRALLAYLAVEAQRQHERARLASLLWPDKPQRAALRNLSNSLSQINSLFNEMSPDADFLLVSRQTVQFNPNSPHFLDVAEMQKALASGQISRIEEANLLYRGEFLEGFSIPDSSIFETWMLQTREHLQIQIFAALYQVAEHFLKAGALEQAQKYAQRQIQLDQWHEAAYAQLMKVFARRGQRAAALGPF